MDYANYVDKSIGISDSFRSIWSVKDRREHSDFTVADISLPEVLGLLSIRQLHQELHNVIGTSIRSLIPFSETWVMVLVLHVGQSTVWAPIVLSGSVMSVSAVASKPLLESHCAHNVVIWHRVKTVECAFHLLLWTDTALESSSHSSVSESSPFHDLLFFKPPWLEKQCVNIIGLHELIFH